MLSKCNVANHKVQEFIGSKRFRVEENFDFLDDAFVKHTCNKLTGAGGKELACSKELSGGGKELSGGNTLPSVEENFDFLDNTFNKKLPIVSDSSADDADDTVNDPDFLTPSKNRKPPPNLNAPRKKNKEPTDKKCNSDDEDDDEDQGDNSDDESYHDPEEYFFSKPCDAPAGPTKSHHASRNDLHRAGWTETRTSVHNNGPLLRAAQSCLVTSLLATMRLTNRSASPNREQRRPWSCWTRTTFRRSCTVPCPSATAHASATIR